MKYTGLLLAMALAGALYAAPDLANSPDKAQAATGGREDSQTSGDLTDSDRVKLENMAKESLDALLSESAAAKKRYEQSELYAVFNTTKVGALVTGAGGSGVAVDPGNNECVYMHMGAGGLGLGAGIQQYKLVFLFADHDTFRHFVDGSWDGNTTAQAVAGKAAKDAVSNFADKTAVFQVDDKGLVAQADVTLMRFWKDHDTPANGSNTLRCAS